jgi:hypothetical protein
VKDKQDQQNKTDEMKIIREVNIQAEALYEEAKKLGEQAADVLGKDHRAQLTGLENIAESAFKTSDIFDYVKRQTARHEEWRKGGFGKKLIDTLETELASKRKGICGGLKIGEKTDEGRRIHLLLIRQFIRQMVVHYEFWVSVGKEEKRNGTH